MKIPKYHAASETIARKIRAGDYQPGERLPAERVLGDQLGISRMTARQVYVKLERSGFVSRSDRSGWYVAYPRLEYQLAGSASFVSNIERIGALPTVFVQESRIIRPSEMVATALGIAMDIDVAYVNRLFMAADRPTMVENLFVPSKQFPDLLDAELNQSILALWESKYGITIKTSDAKIHFTQLPESYASLLAVENGAAGICLTQVFRTQKKAPVGLSQQYWRGDVAEFAFSINYT